jgi:hypothetical protein
MKNIRLICALGLFVLVLDSSYAQTKTVSLTTEKILSALKPIGSTTKVIILTSVVSEKGKSIPKKIRIESYNPPKPPILAKIVCSGKGASFAYCVRDFLIANPGKCLKVSESGGVFVADDDCN